MKALGFVAVVLSSALVAGAPDPGAPARDATAVRAQDAAGAPAPAGERDLDLVIDALPAAGRELVQGGESERPVEAAERLRRHLDAGGALSDAQWRRALLATGAIRLRSSWPQDVPFALGVVVPWWLGAAEIRVAARTPGWRAARARAAAQDPGAAEVALYQELGALPAPAAPGGAVALVLDVEVARAGVALWSGAIEHAVRRVATVAEAVPPESGARADALVRASAGLAFRTGPYDDEPDRSPVLVIDAPADADAAQEPPLALVLRVEVLHAGAVVEERRVVALARERGAPDPDPYAAWVPLAFLPEDAAVRPDALAGWSVRLTGVEAGVLGVFGAERRYEGAVEIALADARARELERARAHGREPWPWRPRPR